MSYSFAAHAVAELYMCDHKQHYYGHPNKYVSVDFSELKHKRCRCVLICQLTVTFSIATKI